MPSQIVSGRSVPNFVLENVEILVGPKNLTQCSTYWWNSLSPHVWEYVHIQSIHNARELSNRTAENIATLNNSPTQQNIQTKKFQDMAKGANLIVKVYVTVLDDNLHWFFSVQGNFRAADFSFPGAD